VPGAGGDRQRRVYVDAKILNMHDPKLPKLAYVGYVVEETGEHDAKQVEATESDDAETLAVLFAIEELKGALGGFKVVCDHQSVVSEATRESVKNPSAHMAKLREMLRDGRVKLEALQANPAHRALTEYVNGLKAEQAREGQGAGSRVAAPAASEEGPRQ
jgi:hypothetical protein